MRPSWVIIAASLTLAIRPGAAQVPAVYVDSAGAELEVWFPAVPHAETGCRYVAKQPGATGRGYSWRAWADFPDSQYPHNHFMLLAFEFYLPDEVELTATRFDSIVAATPVRITELSGEPPIFGRPYKPIRAGVRRDADHRTLFIHGRDAVDAFLRTGVDSVGVSWCERRETATLHQVRLERR